MSLRPVFRTAHRRTAARRIALVAACVPPVVLAGCTSSYPVVGAFDNYNEVFLGNVDANPANGTGFIEVKGQNSGIKCTGRSFVVHVPTSNYIAGMFLIPYCGGQRGKALLTCDDGRSIDATYTVESCGAGFGDGSDGRGGRFRFTFGMSQADAQARLEKSRVEVASLPELPVYRPRETRRKIGFATGTGFLVSSAGHLVTNFHVIEDAKEVLIRVGEREIRAEVLKKDEQNDIALLKADLSGEPIALPGDHRVVVADEVMTLGYPLVSIQGQALKASFGRVNALSGIADDPRFLQIDVPIQPGNSGGPLVNARGELVGVVTATLDQAATLRAAGTLTQNVNYAVKFDYVLPLLRDLAGVKRDAATRDFKTLAQDYGKSVFLVVAK